jgi:hypothetical protein
MARAFAAPAGQASRNSALRTLRRRAGRPLIAIICSLVALIVLPPIFGGIAIWQALRVKKHNPDTGNMLLAAAIVCTIAGMIIGAFVWTSA